MPDKKDVDLFIDNIDIFFMLAKRKYPETDNVFEFISNDEVKCLICDEIICGDFLEIYPLHLKNHLNEKGLLPFA